MSIIYVHRCSLVPPAHIALARGLTEGLAGPSGANMWIPELEAIAAPGTIAYYAANGAMQDSFAALLPLDQITVDKQGAATVTRVYAGRPNDIYAAAQAEGSPVTLAQINALMAAVIVTDTDWQVVTGALGLRVKQGAAP